MTYPGFILAGAEKNIRCRRKKSGGAESHLKGPKKFLPPTKKKSAPGAEQAKGGAERERGRNI